MRPPLAVPADYSACRFAPDSTGIVPDITPPRIFTCHRSKLQEGSSSDAGQVPDAMSEMAIRLDWTGPNRERIPIHRSKSVVGSYGVCIGSHRYRIEQVFRERWQLTCSCQRSSAFLSTFYVNVQVKGRCALWKS
jgi:hypothetical protein